MIKERTCLRADLWRVADDAGFTVDTKQAQTLCRRAEQVDELRRQYRTRVVCTRSRAGSRGTSTRACLEARGLSVRCSWAAGCRKQGLLYRAFGYHSRLVYIATIWTQTAWRSGGLRSVQMSGSNLCFVALRKGLDMLLEGSFRWQKSRLQTAAAGCVG